MNINPTVDEIARAAPLDEAAYDLEKHAGKLERDGLPRAAEAVRDVAERLRALAKAVLDSPQ